MSYSANPNYNPEPLGLLFGAFKDDNELYVADAAIDDVALWDRALSDDEIEWLYNGGNGNALINTGPKVLVAQSGGSTDVTEGGASDSYTISVDTEPTGNVLISATPQNVEIDLGAGPGQGIVLTINPGNWLTPQTVTVSVVDDNIYLGNRTALIEHESQSNEDSRYDKVFVSKVMVNITDDELPVLTDGLVGYWPLDGDILDYSGYDNHGELFNGASYISGKLGSAVSFDGSDDWAALDAVADEMAGEQNAMSWSCWVNYTDVSEQGIFCINSGGHGNVVLMEHHGEPIGIYESGYEVYTPGLADGLWHHVAYTRDGSTGYLYADGVLAGAHNAGFSLNATDLWSLAQEWDTGTSEHFAGMIDDVAVWNRTLTAEEVANIWNGGSGEAIIGDGFVYITLAGSSVEVVEGGASDSYTMVLGNEPNSDVEVTATPSDAEIDLGSGAGVAITVTFNSANWETPQTVTVNAVDDDVYEGKLPHVSKIYHYATSGDENFNERNYSSINVSVVDDEETCGDWGYLQSDMNKDCIVDLFDFSRFALLWLETTDTPL